MKVIEHLERAQKQQKTLFSYEIVPPPRGRSVEDIVSIVKDLAPLQPPWIDVTAHASEAYYLEKDDGSVERKIYKKRPGTLGICGIIQNRFQIDTVAHVLCLGFSREETEDALIELNYLGIHNILALRGDGPNYKKHMDKSRTANHYAIDLVEQLQDLRQGKFLTEHDNTSKLDFGVGVAGYPEKHFEAANLKTDIEYLKQKVDAGSEYIMTQMFFDNSKFFEFVRQCRDAGITVPILPGIKVLRSPAQLVSIPKNFHIDFPEELVERIHNNRDQVERIGIEWAQQQVAELLKEGVPCVHFYVMNDTKNVVEVVKSFQK
jgi:methylenetetrahydrofolate reductase (NADPH)